MSVMKAIALANEEFATAASSTGAPYHDESQTWHDINWRQVNRNVRRLQARIVKATQEGRWGKVKALQHLLTRSFSGKALAVRRVTENKGKRTPGVDKQVWSTPASKRQAVKTLRQHGYRAQPLKRVYIPKKNGKGRRALSIPTMKDRAMQALYRLALDPIAETTGDPNSYGYRKGRAPVDALQQCWTCLNRKCSARWILEADIKDCFDAISHGWLEQHIPLEKRILYQWLKAGYMGKRVLRATEAGVPQGGIISPVIANMTLDGLEAELRAAIPPIPNKYEGTKPKVNLVRFADDFVVTGCSKELLENRVKPVVEQFLRDRELRLSPDKTRITHIDEGFDFLGQNIRKYNGKLLIKPAANNVSAFLDKVRTTIKANRQVPPGRLILLLNPIIRGWANYHRHAASMETFIRVDYEIFWAIWRWSRRRHPRKSAQWVKNRYFLTTKSSRWAFYGDIVLNDEPKPTRLFLIKACRTYFQKHVKVKAKANPYDPEWEAYFEKRLDAKMLSALKGREDLRHLWYSQKGICPVCKEKITQEAGWHSHHIVWRVYGGGDGLANRVLLHPECHRQVHSRGLHVEKPRLS